MSRDNQQQTVSDFEIGWLAGIIEGEGSISLHIHKRSVGKNENRRENLRVTPRIVITNTDKMIIENSISILDRLGVGKWVHTSKPNNVKHAALVKKSYKDIHYIEIGGFKRVQRLLNILAPTFVGDKKVRAKALLQFINKRIKTSEVLDKAQNIQYDSLDVELILGFLKLTRTLNYDKIAGMLNEYTHGTPHDNARVKMYSELTGDSKSVVETPAAA